jgi:hypothetical protein
MGSQDWHREIVASVQQPESVDGLGPMQQLIEVDHSEIPGYGCDYQLGTEVPGDQGREQGDANL